MKKILTIIGLAALVGCQSTQRVSPQAAAGGATLAGTGIATAAAGAFTYRCKYCGTRNPRLHKGGVDELRLTMLLGDYRSRGISPEQVPAINAWLDQVDNNRAAMARTQVITNAIESANRYRYYNYNYPGSYLNPLYVESR
jgi:hypothetical protein